MINKIQKWYLSQQLNNINFPFKQFPRTPILKTSLKSKLTKLLNNQSNTIPAYSKSYKIWSNISGIYNFIPFAKFLLKKYQLDFDKSIDIACGTGTATYFLSKLFEKVIAVDKSIHMLNKAQENLYKFINIEYVNSSMQKYIFPRNISLISCTNDSLNYLLKTEEIEKLFKKINIALKPKGLFIFDIFTYISLLYYTSYISHYKINDNEYYLTDNFSENTKIASGIFICNNEVEIHLQKFYSTSLISELLKNNNFQIIQIYYNGSRYIFITQKKE